MKRTILLRAICIVFLSTAMSAAMSAQKAQVGPTSKGSVVAVKGVANNLRLPKAAGKVSNVGPTGPLVPSAPKTTFVAQGDKRVSLCYLNKASTVTCAPMVNTATLAGIDMSYMQKRGYTLIRFSAAKPSGNSGVPASKVVQAAPKVPQPMPKVAQAAPMVAHAARTFMAGLRKAAVVLEHHAALHIGDRPMPSMTDAGDGGGFCSYDDWGAISCSGGGGGGGGGGDYGGTCWDCDYPVADPDPVLPPDPILPPNEGTVPATNANDPCVETGGTIVCVMTGPRLPPMPVPVPIPPAGGAFLQSGVFLRSSSCPRGRVLGCRQSTGAS